VWVVCGCWCGCGSRIRYAYDFVCLRVSVHKRFKMMHVVDVLLCLCMQATVASLFGNDAIGVQSLPLIDVWSHLTDCIALNSCFFIYLFA